MRIVRYPDGAMEQLFSQLRGRRRPNGTIDYRVARQSTLARFRAGELSRSDVCDAQLELMRVALACSEHTKGSCPVCQGDSLRLVRFVFGPRLPKGGRCVSSLRELRRFDDHATEYRCYVVEVCVQCRWNHLLRSLTLGGRERATAVPSPNLSTS